MPQAKHKRQFERKGMLMARDAVEKNLGCGKQRRYADRVSVLASNIQHMLILFKPSMQMTDCCLAAYSICMLYT